MKIGVISDTHDNRDAIIRSAELFNSEKVSLVLHCGDHIAPFTVEWLSKIDGKIIGVKGNLDAEYNLLNEKYKDKGWEFHRHSAVVETAGKKIIILHGEDENIIRSLAKSGMFNIVVRGHLHRIIDEYIDDVLHFSPGETCGYLTGRRTVGIIRLPEISTEIIEI